MKQYIVDAFTDRLFAGNPAAVCLPEHWPSETLMQNITRENNLSETAFAVPLGEDYHLRWFTPGGEIDLCGHATMACAHVIFQHLQPQRREVRFQTMSGLLTVRRRADLYEMDFPAYELRETAVTPEMAEALGAAPAAAYLGRDLLCVFEDEITVRRLTPDLEKVSRLEGLLTHVTAPGHSGTDCVSRSFAPKLAVPEDPVCGSGHCHIIPYWAGRLGKTSLKAEQASRRGGFLYCRLEGKRVTLGGRAVTFSVADLLTDPQGE